MSFDSIDWMMATSGLNLTSKDILTHFQISEDISNEILVWTKLVLCLTLFAMVFNFGMFVYISKCFTSSAMYQIQRIDALVTCVSMIGMETSLISSISKTPNGYICTFGTGAVLTAVVQPIMSCLFLAYTG